MSLFRHAALQASADPSTGPIAWRAPRARLLAAGAVGCVLATLTGAALLPYGQTLTVRGVVSAGVRAVLVPSPSAGRIDGLIATDRAVLRGAVLARLDKRVYSAGEVPRSEVEATRLEQRLEAMIRREKALAALHAREAAELAAKISRWEVVVASAAAQVDLLRERLALTAREDARMARLAANHWISRQVLTERRHARLQLEQSLEAAASEQTLAQRERQLVEEAAGVHAARVSLAREEQALAVADVRAEIGRWRAGMLEAVLAPVAGLVADVMVQAGDSVAAGQPVATLLTAHEQPAVTLALPARGAARVRPGQRVLLRFDAFPASDHGVGVGRIAQVSRAPRPGESGPLFSAEVRLVALPSGVQRLPAGTALTADVLFRRKPLWRWLLDPLHAAFERLRA